MEYQENQEEFAYNTSDKNKFYPHAFVDVCKTIEDLPPSEVQDFIDAFDLESDIQDTEDLIDYVNSQFSIYEDYFANTSIWR
jgi:hypothetical protein